MLPTPDTIDKYIQKHASRASIQRAKECRVEQDFLEDDSAEYTCLGSSGAHYRITLRYAKKLSAHCTCPYNYGGLCKHSVA
ncbi:MAG: SWIM zinc finger domain-containing protein, partial [Cardiobacterium hominis]